MKNKLLLIGVLVFALAFIFLIPGREMEIENNLDNKLIKTLEAQNVRPLQTRNLEYGPKYFLGQALFFDPILSGPRDVACSTCHLLDRGTSDSLPFSIGTGAFGLGEKRRFFSDEDEFKQPRNALDLFNRDNNQVRSLFWDGRVEFLDPKNRIFRSPLREFLPKGLENTLAVQALFPLTRADEMLGKPGDISLPDLPNNHGGLPNNFAITVSNLDGPDQISKVHELIMERLLSRENNSLDWQENYRDLFLAAYPGKSLSAFSIVDLGNAIARFEEIAFATRNTPWDNYLKGENDAISKEAKQGALVFFGKGRCSVCHDGSLFSDFEFYSLGVPQIGPGMTPNGQDFGRFHATGNLEDKFKFRTPPLRNATLSAPYFHDGVATTLEQAIQMHLDPLGRADQYNEDGSFAMTVEEIEAISPVLLGHKGLNDEEISLLIKFLETLTDNSKVPLDEIIPKKVPSGLPVQGTAEAKIQR